MSFVTAASGEARSAPSSIGRGRAARPVLLFVACFSLVFTWLGAFASVFVPIVRSTTGQRVAGLVVLGVPFVLIGLGIGGLMRRLGFLQRLGAGDGPRAAPGELVRAARLSLVGESGGRLGRPYWETMVSDQDEFLRATMGSMDLMFNLSRRLTDTRQDAEDLVQETFLRAFRAWSEHRRPIRVEPWLATICLNLARSGYRARARRPAEVHLEEWMVESGASADPESRAVQGIEREELYRAIRELPEEQRVAITLVDLSGFSTYEAAEAMGTPRGTVLSRLHRGRRALARLLGDRTQEVTR